MFILSFIFFLFFNLYIGTRIINENDMFIRWISKFLESGLREK